MSTLAFPLGQKAGDIVLHEVMAFFGKGEPTLRVPAILQEKELLIEVVQARAFRCHITSGGLMQHWRKMGIMQYSSDMSPKAKHRAMPMAPIASSRSASCTHSPSIVRMLHCTRAPFVRRLP